MANATTLEQFHRSIVASGLMSCEELAEYLDTFPAEKRPKAADNLVRELVRDGRLTCGQVELLLAGRGKMIFLGNYVLQKCLGKGGMGEVFKATHRRTCQVVAIKVLRELREADRALRRFWQEAKLASSLNHPNIVAILDAGQDHGVNFLVMELVEGCDLAGFIRQHGPRPLPEVLGYVLQAARGLDYAHQRKVIHRDIKPANLLRQSSGTIKILDLGLARMAIDEAGLPPDATQMERLTRTGQLLGTVDYLSPEQALDAQACRPSHRHLFPGLHDVHAAHRQAGVRGGEPGAEADRPRVGPGPAAESIHGRDTALPGRAFPSHAGQTARRPDRIDGGSGAGLGKLPGRDSAAAFPDEGNGLHANAARR